MELTKYQQISLNALDPVKDRFRISRGRPVEALARSMRAVGCLQPVLLRGVEETAEIVSGFRRVEAARRIGLESMPAVFLAEPLSDADVFEAALDLFFTTDIPHPVEQSLIVRKLEAHHSREEIMADFFPRLGLNAGPVIYRRIRAILDLPEVAQAALAEGVLDPVCVPFLERLAEADREPAVALLLRLRPTKSMQKEILEYLHDLTVRDGVTIEQLSKDEAVKKILNREPPNLPQQRDAFRRWLKERRFPVLHRAKSAFEETCRQWKLGAGIKLVPPPFYEGRQHEIRFPFRDPEEFAKRVERLEKVKDRPDLLEKLWE